MAENEQQMPVSIQNDFNTFWNIYGKSIEYMTKSAKKEIGPGVMIVDVCKIKQQLNEDNNEKKEETGQSYYVPVDLLPPFIKNIDEFRTKIENSANNNMHYTMLVQNEYNTLIGNEDETI